MGSNNVLSNDVLYIQDGNIIVILTSFDLFNEFIAKVFFLVPDINADCLDLFEKNEQIRVKSFNS
jgi:hypothetical protein